VHGKPRIKLPLTEEVPLSTTKSDGMWKVPPLPQVHRRATPGFDPLFANVEVGSNISYRDSYILCNEFAMS
jgi:hypothetical protein